MATQIERISEFPETIESHMKNAIILLALLLTVGCKGDKHLKDGIVAVDVNAKYPKKELILQDFMDVEYVPLETNDEFLCQGFILAVGEKFIVARNWSDSGDIFLFDRKTGKAVKKINRKGQGSEEYTHIQRIVLDEEKGEIFVNDHFIQKILIYDIDGNFKRSLQQDKDFDFSQVYNFDTDNLICNNNWVTNRPPFKIISKQDGRTTHEIRIPFDEKVQLMLSVRDEASNMSYGATARTYNPVVPYFDNLILVEPSSDTIYSYQPDHTMRPIIVRTPTIRSMNPEVFLFMTVPTERYYFMEAVKKEFDFNASIGFPATDLLYDRQEKSFFRYIVYNDDYAGKVSVDMKSAPVNNEISCWKVLDAPELIGYYKKGKLKGNLEKIVATLDEESNPVIMLIKHKKQ